MDLLPEDKTLKKFINFVKENNQNFTVAISYNGTESAMSEALRESSIEFYQFCRRRGISKLKCINILLDELLDKIVLFYVKDTQLSKFTNFLIKHYEKDIYINSMVLITAENKSYFEELYKLLCKPQGHIRDILDYLMKDNKLALVFLDLETDEYILKLPKFYEDKINGKDIY